LGIRLIVKPSSKAIKHYILIPLLLVSSLGLCQEVSSKFEKKNSAQLELAGHGLAYSFNYERVILNGNKFKTTAQIGAAYYPPETDLIEVWVPIIINEIRSFGNNHAEIGVGYIFNNETTLIYDNAGNPQELIGGFITGRVGYRYQKLDGDFLFRIAFTPFIEKSNTYYIYPSGGVTFGYSF